MKNSNWCKWMNKSQGFWVQRSRLRKSDGLYQSTLKTEPEPQHENITRCWINFTNNFSKGEK
jgi:hypothetical protein